MTYSAGLYGGQLECGVLNANGHLDGFNVSLTFTSDGDTEAWANDMFLLIKNNYTYPNSNFICYQYGGYDYNAQGCAIVGEWPTSWENQESVTGYADMTDAELTITGTAAGAWEICIGNGWRECPVEVGYTGTVTVYDLDTFADPPEPANQPTFQPTEHMPTLYPTRNTAAPTPTDQNSAAPTAEDVIVEERCGLDAIVQFDVDLIGKAYAKDYFPGDGALTSINVSMWFGGAAYNTAEWASDMLLVVKMLDNSSCIVVGGFDYNIPNCDFLGYWPSEWETSEPGTYTHVIDLSEDNHGLAGNNSYAVSIANGYIYGENPVYYDGDITLVGIKYDCYFPPATYILQESGVGQPAKLIFEGQFAGTEQVCTKIHTSTAESLNNIVMNPLTFNANGYPGTWASDMFVTVTSLSDGSTEEVCIQYGGYDYHALDCSQSSNWHWPSAWEESDKDGGTDTTPADYDNKDEAQNDQPGGGDVSSENFHNTQFEVCIGNGWRESSGIAFYKGYIELQGLLTSTEPETMAPTMAPTGTRASPTPMPTTSPEVIPTMEPTVAPSGERTNMQMDSEYETTATVGFDTFEKGDQNKSISFPATGTLKNISIDFNFGGAPQGSGEWASDMLLLVKAPDGTCVQVGGFDINEPGCTYEDKWPEEWDTSDPGLYQHTALITKTTLTGDAADGNFTAYMINGYIYGTQYVTYQGEFKLNGILDANNKDVTPRPPPNDDDTAPAPAPAGGGSDDTPVEDTAAFIVPITLLVIGIVGGAIFYAYYNWAVSQGKWKAWGGSSGGSSWRSKDVKPALTSSILSEGSGPGAYVPPTVAGQAVVNPMRNQGGPMSRDERL